MTRAMKLYETLVDRLDLTGLVRASVASALSVQVYLDRQKLLDFQKGQPKPRVEVASNESSTVCNGSDLDSG